MYRARCCCWENTTGPRSIGWIGLLDGDCRVVFAGAHLGAVLVPIVRATSTRAVLAFEPSPRNFRLLTMNLRLNGIDGVVVRNVALGERPGTIQFTENSINTGNSRVAPADGEITVAMETLDRTIPADWESIDLVVMDTEGSEVAAMRGGQATLARTRNLYVEFAPEQLREQGSSAAEFAARLGGEALLQIRLHLRRACSLCGTGCVCGILQESAASSQPVAQRSLHAGS